MKVLVIHNKYRTSGGEESHVKMQVRSLRAEGIEVVEYLKDSNDIRGLRGYGAASVQMIHSLSSAKDIEKLLQQDTIDVAHVHNLYPLISPSVLKVLRKHGIPVVMTLHNYRLICPSGLMTRDGLICSKCINGAYLNCVIHNCLGNLPQSTTYALALWWHRILSTVIDCIDYFISPSEFLKGQIMDVVPVPSERILVIRNAFEPTSIFQNDNSSAFDYGLYIGRLAKEKGLYTLVKAFQELPNYYLKIAGDGEVRQDIERYLRQNNIVNIEMVGYKSGSELYNLIGNAKYVIVPSEWNENAPYAAIESLFLGKPLIGSNIGGLPEIIKNEWNGVLFEPGNVRDLKRKIVQLSHMDLSRMSNNSRKLASEEYSIQKYISRLLQLYSSLQS